LSKTIGGRQKGKKRTGGEVFLPKKKEEENPVERKEGNTGRLHHFLSRREGGERKTIERGEKRFFLLLFFRSKRYTAFNGVY